MLVRPLVSLALALAVVAIVRPAFAEPPGDAPSALPGIVRVGIPWFGPPRVAADMALGYGTTEALAPSDGQHHRAIGIAALSVTPLDWLSLAARTDVRYDRHRGGDDGWIADPSLAARAGRPIGEHAAVGIEAGLRFSGAESASITLDSVSPRVVLQGAWMSGGLTLAAEGGYRFDRSREAGRNFAQLSFGDRVALGLSDFDAVVAGLGVSYRLGGTEILAELSGDVLVGSGAPPFSESPLRASGGVRQHLSPMLALALLAEGSLSSRPSVNPTDPLIPIEPRIAVLAALGLSFDLAPKAASTPIRPRPPRPRPVAPPPAPTTTQLTITVNDDKGKPVSGGRVTLETPSGPREAQTDPSGKATVERVPRGHAKISAEADGYEPATRDVVVDPAHPVAVDLTLTAKAAGQVRGLIRAFSGVGIPASVRVEPLGIEATADAQGYFEINVPAGKYDVVIEAPGYRAQRTSVEVQRDGVVVVNADLFKQ